MNVLAFLITALAFYNLGIIRGRYTEAHRRKRARYRKGNRILDDILSRE